MFSRERVESDVGGGGDGGGGVTSIDQLMAGSRNGVDCKDSLLFWFSRCRPAFLFNGCASFRAIICLLSPPWPHGDRSSLTRTMCTSTSSGLRPLLLFWGREGRAITIAHDFLHTIDRVKARRGVRERGMRKSRERWNVDVWAIKPFKCSLYYAWIIRL